MGQGSLGWGEAARQWKWKGTRANCHVCVEGNTMAAPCLGLLVSSSLTTLYGLSLIWQIRHGRSFHLCAFSALSPASIFFFISGNSLKTQRTYPRMLIKCDCIGWKSRNLRWHLFKWLPKEGGLFFHFVQGVKKWKLWERLVGTTKTGQR